MGIALALTNVIAAFRGAVVSVNGAPTYSLRATADPNDIQTPTVFVPPPDVAFSYAKKRITVTWTAYLIPPTAPKQKTTSDHLSAMIDAVTGIYPFTTADLFSLTLPGGNAAQCYRLTWESHETIGE